jgi:hypothetical protein
MKTDTHTQTHPEGFGKSKVRIHVMAFYADKRATRRNIPEDAILQAVEAILT